MGFEPMQCSGLPTELSSQLGDGQWYRKGHGFELLAGLNFFQVFEYNCDDQ